MADTVSILSWFKARFFRSPSTSTSEQQELGTTSGLGASSSVDNSYGRSNATTISRGLRETSRNVPENHRKFRLTLHTTGAYAATEETDVPVPSHFDRGILHRAQHRLFDHEQVRKRWIPRWSGRSGRVILLLILLSVVACHWQIVQRTKRDGATTLSRYMPSILGILLAKSTSYICAQESRRIEHQMSYGLDGAQKHRYVLLWTHIVLILVVAPLTSVPATLGAAMLHENRDSAFQHFSPSWLTIMEGMENTYPSVTHLSTSDSLSNPIEATDLVDERWLIPSSIRQNLPNAVQFVGPNKPTSVSLWGDAGHGHGVLTPFDQYNIRADSVLHTRWMDRGNSPWGVTVYLECEKLNVPTNLTLSESRELRNVSISVTDSQGCMTSLMLSALRVPADYVRSLREFMEKYDDFLDNHSKTNGDDFELSARVRDFRLRLSRYATLLDSSTEFAAFKPSWELAQPEGEHMPNSICRNKYIFAAPADPVNVIREEDTMIQLQAASCIPKLKLFEVEINDVTGSTKNSFRNQDEFLANTERLPGLTNLSTASPAKADDLSEDYQIYTKLRDALRNSIQNVHVFDSSYAFQLLRYQFLAMSNKEADSYHAIVYGANHLMSTITRKMAAMASSLDTFGMARELSTTGIFIDLFRPYPEAELCEDVTYLRIWMLQLHRWYMFIYWLSVLVSISLLYVNHRIANDDHSGLPWDISSIAAKAALLYKSRLRESFETHNHEPHELRKLYPLHIGTAAEPDDHFAKSWRIDSLLRQCTIPTMIEQERDQEDDVLWIPGLGLCGSLMRKILIILPFAILVGITTWVWKVLRTASTASDDTTTTSHIIPIIMSNRIGVKRASHELCLKLFPGFVAFFVLFYWLEGLLAFSKAYLPWAGLLQPGVAKNVLTLNYFAIPFPILKALNNRHLILLMLWVGSLILLPLPAFVQNLSRYDWELRTGEQLPVTVNHTWDYDEAKLANSNGFHKVLKDTIIGLTNSSALPTWSSYRETLLPVALPPRKHGQFDIQTSSTSQAGYWELEIDMIRAELNCRDLHHEYVVGEAAGNGQSPVRATLLRIYIDRELVLLDGSNSLIADPCFGQMSERPNDRQKPLTCSHWELVQLSSSGGDRSRQNIWIVMAAEFGHAGRKTRALLCEPQVFTGRVKARLFAPDNELGNAVVQSQTTLHETVTKNSLAGRYSQIVHDFALSTNNMYDDEYEHGFFGEDISQKSAAVSFPHFKGDILSLMAYQWATQRGQKITDFSTLTNVSSHIFSATFAIAVQNMGFLDKAGPSNQQTQITRLMWRETFTLNKPALYYTCTSTTLILAGMLAHVIILLLRGGKLHHPRFPYPPHILENSLFYLYQSSIVDRIGNNIENPEDLTLSEFHARVNSLPELETPSFGLPKTGSGSGMGGLFRRPRVDVEEELQKLSSLSISTGRRSWRFRAYAGRSRAGAVEEAEENDSNDEPDQPLLRSGSYRLHRVGRGRAREDEESSEMYG